MKKNMVSVYLRLSEETNRRVEQLARESGYSRCAYIRQIVRLYLRNLDQRDRSEYEPAVWEVGKSQLET